MKAFMPKNARFPVVTSDNPRLKAWRKLVRDEALIAMGWQEPWARNVAIRVECVFFLPRAKSNKCMDAVKKPDLSKLLRAAEDSMTGVVYVDDSQIIEAHIFKAYGNPRAEIRVEEAGMLTSPLKNAILDDSQIPF